MTVLKWLDSHSLVDSSLILNLKKNNKNGSKSDNLSKPP